MVFPVIIVTPTLQRLALFKRTTYLFPVFKTNDEKCHWQPMQIGEWLGMIINTVKFQFQIPPRKIEKVKKNIAYVLGLQLCFISAIGKDRGFYQFTLFGCRPTSQAFLVTTFFLDFSERFVVWTFGLHSTSFN